MDNNWNPMREAFHDPRFNTYKDGPGANLDLNAQPCSLGAHRKQQPCKLYVGNISTEIDKEGIENIFRNVGRPIEVLRFHPKINSTKAWAFVTFGSLREAEDAMRKLNRRPPMNFYIEFARGNKETTEQISEIMPENPNEQFQDRELRREGPLFPKNGRVSKGRGIATAMYEDLRVQRHSMMPERVGNTRTFQQYSGSNYDESNSEVMRVVQRGIGPSGPQKFVMGRGSFDREMDGFYHSMKLANVVDNEQEAKKCIENFIKSDGVYEFSRREFPPGVVRSTCTCCGQIATQYCGQCQDWYCSRACQEKDWPRHKEICLVYAKNSNGEYSTESYKKETPPAKNKTKPFSKHQKDDRSFKKKLNDSSPGKNVSTRFSEENGNTNMKYWKDEGTPVKSEDSMRNRNVVSPKTRRSYEPGKFSKYKKETGDEKVKKYREKNGKMKNKHSDFSNEDEKGHLISKSCNGYEDNGSKSLNKSLIPSKVRLGCEETEELSCSSFTSVTVQVAVGPDEYWVQLTSNIASVLTMSLEMEKFEDAAAVNPVVGAFCMAKYTDVWCRAKIISLEHLKSAKIFFIDYGNVESCGLDEIKVLPESVQEQKSQGIRIRLYPGTSKKYQGLDYGGSLSVKSIKRNKEISLVYVEGETYSDHEQENYIEPEKEEPIKLNVIELEDNNIALQSVTVLLKPKLVCCMKVTEYNGEKEFLATLFPADQTEHYNSLFNPAFQNECEKMSCANFQPDVGDVVVAKFTSEGWLRAYVLHVTPRNEYVVASCDLGVVDNVKNVKKLPKKWREIAQFAVQCGLKGTSEIQGLKKFNGNVVIESCSSESAVCVTGETSGVHCNIEVQKWVTPYELYKELKCVPLKNGECILSAVMSSVEMYVRPVTNACVETFNRVLQNVARHCFTTETLQYVPKVGQVLAAEFTEDKNFYRAVVREVHPSKGVKVQYIDFGNVEYVQRNSLKPLSKQLRDEDCCAVKVVLEDVVDKPLNEEIQKLFKGHVLDGVQLNIKLKEPNSNVVRLYTRDGVDLNQKINETLAPTWKKGIVDKGIYSVDNVRVEELESKITYELVVISVCGFSIFARPKLSKFASILENDLQPAINEYCALSNEPYTPRSGELCLANINNTWYRCLCLSGGNTLSLFRIDVGDAYSVTHENIRKYLEEFSRLPTAGFLCDIVTEGDLKSKTVAERIQMYLNATRIVIAEVIESKIKQIGLKAYSIRIPELDEFMKSQK